MTTKTAIRTCIACRQAAPKPSLVRIVRTPAGQVLLDAGGRQGGRGAYLCPDSGCLQAARRSKRLERALRTEIDEQAWLGIEQAFNALKPLRADKEQC